MKKIFRVNKIMVIFGVVLTGLLCVACTGGGKEAPLVLQALDYTDNPVDIPNPDMGFERGNDDAAGLGAFTPNSLNLPVYQG